jgi:hypothetical protein
MSLEPQNNYHEYSYTYFIHHDQEGHSCKP